MNQFRTYDLTSMPSAEVYGLLTNWVVPRPIALVSSVSASGSPNLAPFSFFMIGGASPASLMVSPVLDSTGSEKDTLRNIRETGEFVVNLVHREVSESMNQASLSLPREVSEWEYTNFTPISSTVVKPQRVSEALVQLECCLFNVVEHGSGPGAARYVIGEIVAAHTAERATEWNPIARLGGADYLDLQTREAFSLTRPSLT